jgi:RimJ/RimL family protein N-acetyltransferase
VQPSQAALPGLRPVSDRDADALIELITAAYAEYPGCVLDLPGVDADLQAPATTAAQRGGRWWVLEQRGRVIASIGTGPLDADGHLELKRLYLDRTARGQGLATAMIAWVEAHAAGLGAVAVELWSDTRFTAAHHRYEQLGYGPTGEDRHLGDPSDTTEYRFTKAIAPTPPRREVAWDGPEGRDRCAVVDLPDGISLRGTVADVHYAIELDAAGSTRLADVTSRAGRLQRSSDGAGRWWCDGRPDPSLEGCADVDLEVTPATNALPIRRLAAAVGQGAAVTAAWMRPRRGTVEAIVQRYDRLGERRWRYASGGFSAILEVDEDGLPITYTDLHPAEASPTPGARAGAQETETLAAGGQRWRRVR